MQVRFEVTVDEMAEAHLELYLATTDGRRQPVIAGVVTAVASGLMVLYLYRMSTPVVVAPIAVAVTIGAFFFARWEFRRTVRRRIRKTLAEQLGGSGPVPITVAVEPESLRVEQQSTEVRFRWEAVSHLDDRPEMIRLHAARPQGLIRVPARAFASFDDRAEFVRLSRQYLEAARSAGTAPR